VAALAAASWGLAWFETGSIAAGDWLPYAFLAGLLAALVLAVPGAARLRGVELGALGALVALAGWAAISASWSPVPSLARDEALLTLFYALAFVVPLLTLRTQGDRIGALAAIAVGSASLALAAGIVLRFGGDQADHFYTGRLSFPISYPNALAAVFLVGFWPAVVLAADRARSPITRSLALGGAAAISSGWLTAQSKGGVLAIAVSAALLFALSPLRLRLLVPTLSAACLTAAAYEPLTRPFRSGNDVELVSDARGAGTAILLLAAVGAGLGLVYALGDRRLALGPLARGISAAGALVLFLATLAGGVALFLARVDHPRGWLGDQWRAFKHAPTNTASSHLLQLGSFRYDIWRVALKEFRHHPLAGIGSRGFGPAYLQNRHSPDTPVRAHSVELDALSELGLVGLILLVAALVLPLTTIVTRARARDPAATAAFAGVVYWLAHASVDWLWTVPACGLPFFLLLGLGCAGGKRPPLARRAALPAAAALTVLALVAFVPPWLSDRLSARGQIHWAKRLDPLSVSPYVTEAARAPSPKAATVPLVAAVRKEPRVVELRFDLAQAYIRAHEWRAARRALLVAKRLDPGERRFDEALRSLPRST